MHLVDDERIKAVIATVRLFNASGPDRVAMVTVHPAWGRQGEWTVQVVKGPSRASLGHGSTHGPFAVEALAQGHAEVMAALESAGYQRAGLRLLLAQLRSQDVKTRAHAAARLGWMGDSGAVTALLDAARNGEADLCVLVDALGRIGDPRDSRVIALAREESQRKLLSRRRAGAEALRNLGDTEGLRAVHTMALARLPAIVADLLDSADPEATDAHTLDAIGAGLKGVATKDLGLAIDTLYELGTPLCVALVARQLSVIDLGSAHIWRYAKSVFKRAMLRGDDQIFALIALRIERESLFRKATKATVKSGLDGATRAATVFGPATRIFIRRAAWRHLRTLARWRPESYTRFAVSVLAGYTDGDRKPKLRNRSRDEWAHATLFNHILRAEDPRFRYNWQTLGFNLRAAIPPAPGSRLEAFSAVWDAHPQDLVLVLLRTTLVEAHRWAVERITLHHPEELERASFNTVLSLVDAPFESTVKLGLDELDRRVDPQHPDWSAVDRIVSDSRPAVQALARRLITSTVSQWSTDLPRTLAYLQAPDALTRSVVAGLTIDALRTSPPSLRDGLATRALELVTAPEAFDGALDGVSKVLSESLFREASAKLSLDDILSLLNRASSAVQSAAGAMLAAHPDAFDTLGLRRVVVLATHDVANVRRAAHSLLSAQTTLLRTDSTVLFSLVECEWADTRAAAFELLRTVVDPASVNLQTVLALCDSNRDDVQEFGKRLALEHFDTLDPQALTHALSEHPAPAMRRFALDLATAHLKDGFVALARLEEYFRRTLFALRPSRADKRRVVAFLLERGLRDERQAEVSARILGDVVRTRTREDFESVLEALVRLRLKFPSVDSAIEVTT